MTIPKRPQSLFLWLRSETFVHVGTSQTASLIDLPIARESGTDYPYIPGSGMKGALRDCGRLRYPPELKDDVFDKDHSCVRKLFGGDAANDPAGQVVVSDARLAFLPLRSLHSAFVMATCPHILTRIARDLSLANHAIPQDFVPITPAEGEVVCTLGKDRIFIEEFSLKKKTDKKGDEIPDENEGKCSAIAAFFVKLRQLLALIPLVDIEPLFDRIVVLRDEDFAYFCRRGVHVRMRNALKPDTKTVKDSALWSEESLAPDTVLYSIITPRNLIAPQSAFSPFLEILDRGGHYVQVGGNETVGEGWLKVLNDRQHLRQIAGLPTTDKSPNDQGGGSNGKS